MHTVIPFSERNIYFPRLSDREEPPEGWKWWTHDRKVTTQFHFTEPPRPKEDAWNAAFIQLPQVWDVNLAGRRFCVRAAS